MAEIDREVDYYEWRQTGLGTGLEDEIEAAFSLILRFPEAAPQWRDGKIHDLAAKTGRAPEDLLGGAIPYLEALAAMTTGGGFDLHPAAAQDITDICEYIAAENPQAARRVREG